MSRASAIRALILQDEQFELVRSLARVVDVSEVSQEPPPLAVNEHTTSLMAGRVRRQVTARSVHR